MAGTVVNLLLLVVAGHAWARTGPRSLRADYARHVEAALAPTRAEGRHRGGPRGVPRGGGPQLRRSRAVGRPAVAGFRASIRGRIRGGPTRPWMPFTGEQVNVYGPDPCRIFFMDATMMGLPVDVLHVFDRTTATMRVRAPPSCRSSRAPDPRWTARDRHRAQRPRSSSAGPRRCPDHVDVSRDHTATASFTWATDRGSRPPVRRRRPTRRLRRPPAVLRRQPDVHAATLVDPRPLRERVGRPASAAWARRAGTRPTRRAPSPTSSSSSTSGRRSRRGVGVDGRLAFDARAGVVRPRLRRHEDTRTVLVAATAIALLAGTASAYRPRTPPPRWSQQGRPHGIRLEPDPDGHDGALPRTRSRVVPGGVGQRHERHGAAHDGRWRDVE